MKNKILAIVLTAILLSNFSCQDVLEKYPLDNPSDVSYPKNEQELLNAINGVYQALWYKPYSGDVLPSIIDCLSDIAFDREGNLYMGSDVLNSTYGVSSGLWKQYYLGIARCNFLLTNMIRAKQNASLSIYNQVEAQALFLRAYWYYQLVALYGDVPLITTIQSIDDSNVARSPKAQIIDLILKDLDKAVLDLPLSWSGNDKGRITKGAALALKSRIALYNEKWEIAAQAAKQIMDLKIYTLYPNYEQLFQYVGEGCSEVIFDIPCVTGVNKSIEVRNAGNFLSRNSQGGGSNKVPTQQLVDSYECIDGKLISESPLYNPTKPFENRDPRLKYTVAVPGDVWLGFQYETYKDSVMCWNYNVVPAQRIPNLDATNPYASYTGYCWRKMVDPLDQGAQRNYSSLNYIAIRYAEVLLIYAEAKIELNQIDQSVYDAINAVRSRANVKMPAISSGESQSEMRKIVRRERKVELALEGQRLFDIYRWKIAEKCLNQAVLGRPNKPYNFKDQGKPVFDNDEMPNYNAYIKVLTTVRPRTFAANNYLWPIPQYEMDINKLMKQNPNY